VLAVLAVSGYNLPFTNGLTAETDKRKFISMKRLITMLLTALLFIALSWPVIALADATP
jgi:hypothetical protein